MFSDILFRMKAVFRRGRFEREMNDELREHFQRQFEKLTRSGLSREEAMRQSRLIVGGPEQLKEQVRDARGTRLFEAFTQDVRYAARLLRKSPGFTFAVVVMLALGIGVNMAMSGAVNALLFSVPIHISNPDEITDVILTDRNPQFSGSVASYPEYLRIQQHSALLEVAAQTVPREVDFGRGQTLRKLRGCYVTDTYFGLLRAPTFIGRTFSPAENDPRSAAHVAILSFALWKVAFAETPDILNREIYVEGQPFAVIGVAPKDFNGINYTSVDIWLPIAKIPTFGGPRMLTDTGSKWFETIARVRRPASRAAAEAEATSAFQHAGAVPGQTIKLVPHFSQRRSKFSESARISLWLAGTAFLVLLIACANVTNLFLERLMQRSHEMAVRLQLGATRARLVCHALSEILLLGVLAGLAALGVLLCSAPLIRAFLFSRDFYQGNFINFSIFWLALFFTFVVLLCTGSLVAWRASQTNVMEAIKAGAGFAQSRRRAVLRTGLLCTQVALTFLLTVGAALFVKSLKNVHSYDLGYEADKVVLANVDLNSDAYKSAEKTAIFQGMLERARQLPEIESVAIASMAPFISGTFTDASTGPGASLKFDAIAALDAISLDYFGVMGIGLIEGRTFLPSDSSGPVRVVVNESLARELWPNQAAIGNCVVIGFKKKSCLEVVGVVRNERRSFTQGDEHPRFTASPGISGPEVYIPVDQAGSVDQSLAPQALFLRVTSKNPKSLQPISAALQGVAPPDRFVSLIPMTDLLDPYTRNWRLGASMFSLFSFLALALTSVGIYAVLSYSVRQRTSEIGVRMALGAEPLDIVRIIGTQSAKPLGIGLGSGILATIWLSRLIRGLLFHVEPGDVASYFAASSVLIVVAVLACWFPARRAISVDPMRALRYQ